MLIFIGIGICIYVAKVTIFGNDIPQHPMVPALNKISKSISDNRNKLD